MGMGFAPTWLRQVSPPASQSHFNHWIQVLVLASLVFVLVGLVLVLACPVLVNITGTNLCQGSRKPNPNVSQISANI